jgi:hypothetical protein
MLFAFFLFFPISANANSQGSDAKDVCCINGYRFGGPISNQTFFDENGILNLS